MENCVFREVFLPLIPNRVSEMAKHIHLLRVWGTFSIFYCTNFVILDPSSVRHPTASAHTLYNVYDALILDPLGSELGEGEANKRSNNPGVCGVCGVCWAKLLAQKSSWRDT